MAKQNDDMTTNDVGRKVEKALKRSGIIKEKTAIPLVPLIALCLTLGGMIMTGAIAYVRRGWEVERIREHIERLESSHKSMREDPFTSKDMTNWINLFRAHNGDMHIPQWDE